MILSTLPEIEQFIQGLNINGVLDVMRSNPMKSRKLLQFSEAEKLNADKVDQLFQFCYSPTGSNNRRDEEAIAFNFTHYLQDVEADRVSTSILDPDTDDLNSITVQLTHILQFVTGCPTIPATGFDKQLSVMFNHTETQRKLTANTCSCTLYLPVSKVLVEYESFKQEFTECMFSSPAFGVV
ncbi:G2/M phase-specific E3 ubiquitin-protein ligase-like [Actinia tenebrosa]|uniref:G2/M phase-specific E3 ubiquitin-protein ligase-like n=1 Tax=Actinia tenebrosa TaxID=6105 RepID=A0A6P8J8I1_ACTTE|nr:G2/M phase-specific E3 ubiquitin-protein ligase-like [Actinia tenebrosa]